MPKTINVTRPSHKKCATSDLFTVKPRTAKASREKLGENIRKARIEQGISQEQLGFEAEISRELVSRIENGQRNLSHDTIHKIAGALNLEVQELFDFNKSK